MDDLHLADFVELQLKSKHDFNAVYDVALSAGLRDYMRKCCDSAWRLALSVLLQTNHQCGCPKKFTSHNPELGNIPTVSDMVVSHNHSVIHFHSI